MAGTLTRAMMGQSGTSSKAQPAVEPGSGMALAPRCAATMALWIKDGKRMKTLEEPLSQILEDAVSTAKEALPVTRSLKTSGLVLLLLFPFLEFFRSQLPFVVSIVHSTLQWVALSDKSQLCWSALLCP